MSHRVRMRLDLSRLTDALCYVYGIGESEIGYACTLFCSPESVILDIGANVGTTALFFAEQVPRGRVHAFEPSAGMLSALRTNIQLSGLENITVHPFGLAESPTSGRLRLAHEGNPGSAFVTSEGGPGEEVELRVLDDVLDGVLAPDQPLDFVKIDVEGFEHRVLQGGRECLSRHKPVLVIEINDAALERAGTDAQEIFRDLEDLGYRLFYLHRGHLRALVPQEWAARRLYNLVAVHPASKRHWQVIESAHPPR